MTRRSEARLLVDLVEIPSPSGCEAAAARHLVDWCRERGMHSYIDAAGNACAQWGEGPVSLCLLGHVDTVPGAVPVTLRGSILTGRGTVDAKGPLAAFASALARIAVSGRVPGSGSILLVGAVGEETDGSEGANHLLRRFEGCDPPAAVIIGEPSRWDRITLGYRGALRGRSAHRTETSHSGGPQPTAAELAFAAWHRAMECARARNESRDPGLFWRLSPRLLRVDSASDGLTETTELQFGVRIPPGETVRGVREAFDRALGGNNVFSGGEEPYLVERNSRVVRAWFGACSRPSARDGVARDLPSRRVPRI